MLRLELEGQTGPATRGLDDHPGVVGRVVLVAGVLASCSGRSKTESSVAGDPDAPSGGGAKVSATLGAASRSGLGSVLGSIFGAIFVTLLPIVIRYTMEAFGGIFFSPQTVLNLIPNLRLMMFGSLIIFFLIVEPGGLNRLWRNIRSYFRVWPFAY